MSTLPILTHLALLSTPAAATDVDLFEPSASFANGRGTPQGEAPNLGSPGFVGGITVAYAHNPVVRLFEDGTTVPEVSSQVPVTVHVGWTVGDRLRLDALMPLYPWVDAPLTGFRGQAAGDLRLQGAIRIAGAVNGQVGLAFIPKVTLPTGLDDAGVGRGVRGGGALSFGADGRYGGFVADAGATFAQDVVLEQDGRVLGSTGDAVVGAWWRVVPVFRIGVEGNLDVALADLDAVDRNDTAAAHAFVQSTLPSGLGLAIGGGTGLISGIGSPDYRVFGALTFGMSVHDRDHDGKADDDDLCPDEPEDYDGVADDDGCPEGDSDGDGILDSVDKCAMVPEDLDGWDDADGCPDADNDADGVVDGADQCPDVPGSPEQFGCPDTDGDGLADGVDACPYLAGPRDLGGCPDRDHDGVSDDRDQCPDDPCPADEDLSTSDGCPKTVWITHTEVRISDRVEFETGKAILRPESLGVLDRVVDALVANPQLERIEVQGHTDNVGPDEYNVTLSQDRAAAVVAYLAQRGVERARLVPRGYGEAVPMFTNMTPEGRLGNRRVQFVILGRGVDEGGVGTP